MNAGEKESFCESMATLFSPPGDKMVGYVHGSRVRSLLEEYIKPSPADAAMLMEFKTEIGRERLPGDLPREYERLFSGFDGKSVSLVESFYKSWAQDPGCHLPFARGKGLLMGDPALHMAAIFQHAGVEVPERFKACPDHLVLELEFLSALYGGATDREAKQFIADHLDWIPQLQAELIRLHPDPFYASAVGILGFFLKQERERLEI